MQRRSGGKLYEVDYLLGVHDESRLGGLRFKINEDGPFLDNNEQNAAPPWTTLRELEWASLEFEHPDRHVGDHDDLLALLAPGSSLGGARPKASVVDERGDLWIAKFPSRQDTYDVGAWEYVVNILASRCGIDVPTMKISRFQSEHHTVLSKRFDRDHDGGRIHAASAMTMLRRVDGDDHHSSVSYLDLAQVIIQRSSTVAYDLDQLWRRILFNVLISNTDDHLRNHMFLLKGDQTSWSLAPAYDVNPVQFGTGLSLNINEFDNSLDPRLVIEIAPYFRIEPKDASRIRDQVVESVASWEVVAHDVGLSRKEVQTMRRAFRTV
jgi:serine/threonine-protein kinase HipA